MRQFSAFHWLKACWCCVWDSAIFPRSSSSGYCVSDIILNITSSGGQAPTYLNHPDLTALTALTTLPPACLATCVSGHPEYPYYPEMSRNDGCQKGGELMLRIFIGGWTFLRKKPRMEAMEFHLMYLLLVQLPTDILSYHSRYPIP